ncbi:MAG: hypothetical protein PVSMB4_09620 [Ktedonobacterales bacterium]
MPGLAVVGSGRHIVMVGADGSNAGKILYNLDASAAGSRFDGPAAVTNGVLYQGNMDGTLYAIGP